MERSTKRRQSLLVKLRERREEIERNKINTVYKQYNISNIPYHINKYFINN
jgi:hypothetical protein